MEAPLPSDENSNKRNLKKAQNNRSSPEAKSRNKLGSVLKLERLERSYDVVHPPNSKNLDNEPLKAKGRHQMKKVETNSHGNEELVMYMSNVPSYLEKGENPREKTFNVGVLDWRLLKKWETNRKDKSPMRGKELLFSGNMSEFISSEESPGARSSRGYTHSSTVPQQRAHRPSSSHHLKSPSSEGYARGIKHLTENREKFPRCKNSLARALDEPQGTLPENGTDQLKDSGLLRHSFDKGSDGSVLKPKDAIHDSKCFFPDPAHDCVERSGAEVFDSEFSKDARSETNQDSPASGSISVPSTRTKNVKEDSGPDRGNLNENAYSQAKTVISDSASNHLPTSCSSSSNCDVPNATNRSRSSPLRRLLDPLLKPISGNSRHSTRSRKPSTTNEAVKSSEGSRESQATCRMKVISDLKNGSSNVQALMQVVVKNGIPLFTFTVDNCSDILAATVKESYSSKRKTKRWIYTFFSFKETKKRNGYWIYQGSKDRNHEYISNIVAQMKVSDASDTDPNRQTSMTREFVLFSVDQNGKTSELLPGDELAAIIMKYPENTNGEVQRDGELTGMNEPIREDCSFYGNGPFNATVLLPGGDHGVPSKGEPSPLIKRWKTGGLCDCGGWDLGCRITTLSNNNSSSSTDGFNPTKNLSTAGIFKLFFEEEANERMASFIMSPYKDGIFSLQFDSSIKHIQAFSVVLAVLNRTTSAVCAPDMLGVETESIETVSRQSLQESSAKYSSYPPVSPFGRV